MHHTQADCRQEEVGQNNLDTPEVGTSGRPVVASVASERCKTTGINTMKFFCSVTECSVWNWKKYILGLSPSITYSKVSARNNKNFSYSIGPWL